MHYVLSTMYYVLCTMYYVLCTMYYVLCTLYYVLCTMYYVLCTLYYVLCTMLLGTIRVAARALEPILWEFEATPDAIIFRLVGGSNKHIKTAKI